MSDLLKTSVLTLHKLPAYHYISLQVITEFRATYIYPALYETICFPAVMRCISSMELSLVYEGNKCDQIKYHVHEIKLIGIKIHAR